MLAITHQFVADNQFFLKELGRAWTKLVNADMFDGLAGNLCQS